MIAGLIDNRVQESFREFPGCPIFPFLVICSGAKTSHKSNTELIVMVTPEITVPLQAGDPKPSLNMPHEFMTTVTPRADAGAGRKTRDTETELGWRARAMNHGAGKSSFHGTSDRAKQNPFRAVCRVSGSVGSLPSSVRTKIVSLTTELGSPPAAVSA